LAILESVEGIGDTGGIKRPLLDVNTFPADFISAGEEEVVENDIGHFIQISMEIHTQIWVSSYTNVDLVLEEFLPKVKKKYAADYMIGLGPTGPVRDFKYRRGSEVFPSNTTEDVSGIVLVHLVTYRERRDDPYSWQ